MHKESYHLMKAFLDKEDKTKSLKILEVGSLKFVGDAYRKIIEETKWEYTGLDLVAGDNVTLLVEDPYDYPLMDNSFDLVISGQTLEHVEYIWVWIKELYRVTRKGGRICLIAPSRGKRHHRPDYWRVQPNGMRALLEWGGFKNIEVNLYKESIWHDCVGTAVKL